MGINKIAFDKIRIYKNQIILTEYGKEDTLSRVFDNSGNHIINRISGKPTKTCEGDRVIITRTNQYETPSKKTFFETIKRVYDKSGRLIYITTLSK